MIASGFWSRRGVVVVGHTAREGAWLALVLSRLNARVTGIGQSGPCLYDRIASVAPLDDLRRDPTDAEALRRAVRKAEAEIVVDLTGIHAAALEGAAPSLRVVVSREGGGAPPSGLHVLEPIRAALLAAERAWSAGVAQAAFRGDRGPDAALLPGGGSLLRPDEEAAWTAAWMQAAIEDRDLASVMTRQVEAYLGLAVRLTAPNAGASPDRIRDRTSDAWLGSAPREDELGAAGAAPQDPAALRSEILSLVERYHAVAHAPKPFDPAKPSVPVSGRVYAANDMRMLVDSALDFWLTTGRFNAAFEKRLAARVGAKHALTVNSGSSANLVAFSALTSPKLGDRALKPGDEVITCATGFPTTVNPVLHWGMVPVFVDVSLPTYNIDVAAIEAAIGPRTRAIMVAHTLGNPFDVAAIRAICDRHDLFLIEDCCDALGATVGGRHVGTFGDVGTLSFYPAHHITMGEGGAVFTNNSRLNKIMESFRDWGRDCYCDPGCDNSCNKRFGWQLGDLPKGYDHKYIYSHLGFNLKITDMQASVGLAQMDHLEDFIDRRRSNFDLLTEGLRPLEDLFVLPEATPGTEPSWFGFPLTLRDDAPIGRDDLAIHLNANGIGTRLLFGGNLIRQPYMKGRTYRVVGSLENADRVVGRTFWIGVYPGLGAEAIGFMVDTIARYCRAPLRMAV